MQCDLDIGLRFGMIKKVKFWVKTLISIIRNISSLIFLKKELQLDSAILNFSRYSRLYNYHRGVKKRVSHVFYSYGVSEEVIADINGSAVIDIGANIGEFSIFLRQYCKHQGEIIAFEPDPCEFNALERNSKRFDLRALNCAVSNHSGKLQFILNNDDADSRLDFFKDDNSEDKITVNSVKLSDILIDLNIKEVGLVKLEAEGFEPEVLQGIDLRATDIKYFAIDCGPERPPNNQSTLVDCLNLLLKNGYELINYNSLRHSILMKKTSKCLS